MLGCELMACVELASIKTTQTTTTQGENKVLKGSVSKEQTIGTLSNSLGVTGYN